MKRPRIARLLRSSATKCKAPAPPPGGEAPQIESDTMKNPVMKNHTGKIHQAYFATPKAARANCNQNIVMVGALDAAAIARADAGQFCARCFRGTDRRAVAAQMVAL